MAEKLGNAIPSISPTESLRMITEHGSLPVNRLQVKQIQTPQVFSAGLIKNAYLQEYSNDFTDDATVLEKTGEKINLIEGTAKILRSPTLKICSSQQRFYNQSPEALTAQGHNGARAQRL